MIDFNIKNTNLIFKKVLLQHWSTEKYSYKNTSRKDYGFLYLYKGLITYTVDDYIIELKPGDIIYLPKGSNYEVYFDAKGSIVENILINFDVIGNTKFTEIQKPICILNDSTKELYEHFKKLLDMFNQKDKPLLTNSYFYSCLNALQEAMQARNTNNDSLIFQQAAKLLAENNEISVNDICNNMPISRSAFQKRFKEYFGLPPIEYRNEKRIKKAKLLLETTDIPIKEIVEMLGYYDTAYFYKIFKKDTSYTPKQYREKTNHIFRKRLINI